ncbi:unnamed protein product [Lathyrus sativus]|nr:unnamed protein product [Lathyrus sativus]
MRPQNSFNRGRPLSRRNSLKPNKKSHKITKNSPVQTPHSDVTAPQNFKDVKQRRTGNAQPTAASDVSPAARLASTKRTTPKKKEKPSWSNENDDMMRMLDNGVKMSQVPGILTPEPAKLPPLTPENFSPITWPATPTDAFSQIFPSRTRTPETLQQRRMGGFSPELRPQSQTALSYNDVRPENNAFANPTESLSPEAGPPQSPESPPNQFNPFNYD